MTQISLCICKSNKCFCASCFDSTVHVIIVALSRNCEMSVRVVSKYSLLQHDVAHFCALGCIIGQTEVVLINKDKKDRSSRIRLCALLIETRECKACLVRWIVTSQGTGKTTWLVWKHHIFSHRKKWVAIIFFLLEYLFRKRNGMHA